MISQVARDDANLSKGYGFVSFNDFTASDSAIANMHGQYLSNKEISVQYAYKKDGKGERHGDAAERMLAEQAREHNVQPAIQPLAPQLFQAATPMAPAAPSGMMNGGGSGYPPQGMPPQRPMNSTPLPPPPSGLPARPPPSQAGYGHLPPGFPAPQPQQGYPPGPPMGFNGYPQQPPQGYAPPGFMAPPPGMPPGMPPPPGYPAYGR